MQSVTTGTFDPSNFATILDHDTNFFCKFFPSFLFRSPYTMLDNVHISHSPEQSLGIGSSFNFLQTTINLPLFPIDAYSNGSLFSLDMGSLIAANSTAIPWTLVQQPDLSSDTSGTITPGANTAGYQPTMALAQNHVHFMGVPGLPAGSVKIFVIHCMF
jgi:hypothetical protein